MTLSGTEVWESEYDEELTGGVGPLGQGGRHGAGPVRQGLWMAGPDPHRIWDRQTSLVSTQTATGDL